MEFDGCTHKDCQWDGWVCRCVHMSVIVQEGTSHIGVLRCPVNAFPNPSPTHPPLLFTPSPLSPCFRVTRDGGCSAVTSAKCSLTRHTVHCGSP